MSNSTTSTLVGILTGTMVGAAIGILYAPDKGANTRKKIKEGTIEAKDNFVAKASEIKETVMHKAADKKATLDEQVEHIVSNASYKAEDVINTLEKQLENLKKKNKKFQKA